VGKLSRLVTYGQTLTIDDLWANSHSHTIGELWANFHDWWPMGKLSR